MFPPYLPLSVFSSFLVGLHLTISHLKPGGWIEIQELHTYPFCDDGSMADDDPVCGLYDLLHEALALRGMNNDKARALRGPLRRAGFVDIQLVKKKVPLGPWAKDKTLRLVGQYLKTAVLDAIPALMARPIAELGLTPLQRQVWTAKVRQSLDDHSIHRHFHFYFWYAQKPVSTEGTAAAT